MKISEDKLHKLLATASVKNIVKFLDCIPIDSGIGYSDLRKQFYKSVAGNMKRTVFYYYLKKVIKNGIVRKDENYKAYYLTRLGVQLVALINNFKEICMEYDISDLDADGRIVVSVKGRRV